MAFGAAQNTDWVNQQLQMFKDWANSILKKRDMAITGLLTEDVGDGVAIINICEIATGMSVGRYNKNPHFPGHKLDNISVAFRFIETKLGARVHCTPNVILEGHTQQVLGLFFILHRTLTHLAEQAAATPEPEPEPEPEPVPEPEADPEPVIEHPQEPDPESDPEPDPEPISQTLNVSPPPNVPVILDPEPTDIDVVLETPHKPPLDLSSSIDTRDLPMPDEELPDIQVVSQEPNVSHDVQETGLTVADSEKLADIFATLEQPAAVSPENVTPRSLDIAQTTQPPQKVKPIPPPKPKPLPQRPIKPGESILSQSVSTNLSAKPPARITDPKEKGYNTLDRQPKKRPVLPLQVPTAEDAEKEVQTDRTDYRSKQRDNWHSPRSPTASREEPMRSPHRGLQPSPREKPSPPEKQTKTRPVKPDHLSNPLAARSTTLPIQRLEEPDTPKKSSRSTRSKSKREDSISGDKPSTSLTASPAKERAVKDKEKRSSRLGSEIKGLETMTLGRKSGRSERAKANSVSSGNTTPKGDKDKDKDKTERSSSRRKGSVTDALKGGEKQKLSDSAPSMETKSRSNSETPGLAGLAKKPFPTVLPKLFATDKRTTTNDEDRNSIGSRSSTDFRSQEEPSEEEKAAAKAAAEKRLAETLALFDANPACLIRLQAAFRAKISRKFPHKLVKEYQRRHHIANEIFTTEVFYVQCLNYLLDKYRPALAALKSDEDQLAVPPNTIKSIFATAQIISGVNKKLLDQIKARMAKWFIEECRIGDIFFKFFAFLKVYTAYVNSYDAAMAAYRQISTNEQVRLELEKCRLDPENPKTLDLPSLLIMPIQRLPRYVLLLQDLLAHTPANHVDYQDLTKALDGMVAIAAEVNLKKKTSDNVAAVGLITSRLIPENCFQSYSTLIYVTQGPISCYDYQDPKTNEHTKIPINDLATHKYLPTTWKQQYMFLFNDNLLFAQPAPAEQHATPASDQAITSGAVTLLRGLRDKIWTTTDEMKTWTIEELREQPQMFFRFLSNIELKGMEIIDITEKPDSFLFGIAPRDSKEIKHIFSFPDTNAKKNFMIELDNCIWSLLFNERTRISASGPSLAKSSDKKKKSQVTISGALAINMTSKPDAWIKKHGVLRGANLILYENENAFISESKSNRPSVISVPLAQVDVLLWPPPGAVTFLDFEKTDDLDTAEEMFKKQFMDKVGNTKNMPLPLIEKKVKYYFVIDKVSVDGSGPVPWVFSVTAQERRMAWINKLRQAILKTYSST